MKKINSIFLKPLQTFKSLIFSGGVIFVFGTGLVLAESETFKGNWSNGDILSAQSLNALVSKIEGLGGDIDTLKTKMLDLSLDRLCDLNGLGGKTVEAYLKNLKAKVGEVDNTLNTLTAANRISLINSLMKREKARIETARLAEIARLAKIEADRIEAARLAKIEADRKEAARLARIEAARIAAWNAKEIVIKRTNWRCNFHFTSVYSYREWGSFTQGRKIKQGDLQKYRNSGWFNLSSPSNPRSRRWSTFWWRDGCYDYGSYHGTYTDGVDRFWSYSANRWKSDYAATDDTSWNSLDIVTK
jgi:hypothetical protein